MALCEIVIPGWHTAIIYSPYFWLEQTLIIMALIQIIVVSIIKAFNVGAFIKTFKILTWAIVLTGTIWFLLIASERLISAYFSIEYEYVKSQKQPTELYTLLIIFKRIALTAPLLLWIKKVRENINAVFAIACIICLAAFC